MKRVHEVITYNPGFLRNITRPPPGSQLLHFFLDPRLFPSKKLLPQLENFSNFACRLPENKAVVGPQPSV